MHGCDITRLEVMGVPVSCMSPAHLFCVSEVEDNDSVLYIYSVASLSPSHFKIIEWGRDEELLCWR